MSWSHHWVWGSLIIVAGLADRRRCQQVLALIWALATLTWMVWWFPAGRNRELTAAWWQKILTDAYEFVGVATLIVLLSSMAQPTDRARQ